MYFLDLSLSSSQLSLVFYIISCFKGSLDILSANTDESRAIILVKLLK